jgi:hypothetical protein
VISGDLLLQCGVELNFEMMVARRCVAVNREEDAPAGVGMRDDAVRSLHESQLSLNLKRSAKF